MAKIKELEAEKGTYEFRCPGCKDLHSIPTIKGNINWTFNGDLDKPTFSPSVKLTWGKYVSAQSAEAKAYYEKENLGSICHYFIKEGRIEFCGDCTHELANQKIELEDIL